MKHQYDYDAATAIGFLRQYGLDKDFKMNIEANHATLAGHTFQHELQISRINGMLGSPPFSSSFHTVEDPLRGESTGFLQKILKQEKSNHPVFSA